MQQSAPVNSQLSAFLDCIHGRHRSGWLAAGSYNRPQWYNLAEPDALSRLARDAVEFRYPYVACATMRNKPPIGSRGTIDNGLAICSLWLDIDIHNPNKPKPNAARDRQHALELIGRFPEPPSWVVKTPHGFHPWWALDRVVYKQDAAELVLGWATTWRGLARPLDIHLDPVWDFARVLRFPATQAAAS